MENLKLHSSDLFRTKASVELAQAEAILKEKTEQEEKAKKTIVAEKKRLESLNKLASEDFAGYDDTENLTQLLDAVSTGLTRLEAIKASDNERHLPNDLIPGLEKIKDEIQEKITPAKMAA